MPDVSMVPPFLPEVVSRLVDLEFIGRLNPSDSPLLPVTLVLEPILGFCEILLLKYYSGHKDIETVKIMKELERRAQNSILAI